MATIKDVAERSGFSVATVSAVLNNVPIVSPEAKRRILQAIEELQYRPNNIARSLKGSKTRSIAILVRDITNPFYPRMVFGLEEYCWKHNYQVILCNTENDPVREGLHLEELLSKRVDGLIIGTTFNQRNAFYDKLRETRIPYLFINRRPIQLYDDEYYVGVNNKMAGEIAVEHLYAAGHRTIACVVGPDEYSTSVERYQGFISGMKRFGLSVQSDWILPGDNTESTGYDAGVRLLKSGKLPRAVFCSNDLMAFGLYMSFRDQAIQVPNDVAIVGCDNNSYGHLIGLTSVDIRNYDMGRTAGHSIVRRIDNGDTGGRRIVRLRPHIKVRSSCQASLA